MGNVLGLCGSPGAGKTEVVRILRDKHGFEVINSKTAVYDMAKVITGLPEKHFTDPVLKEENWNSVEIRSILGELAGSVEELFGDDFLVKKALENHKVTTRKKQLFVVDSLRRYQPEMLKDRLKVVEVVRDGKGHYHWYDNYFLDEVPHFKLKNNGTKADLEENIAEMLKTL